MEFIPKLSELEEAPQTQTPPQQSEAKASASPNKTESSTLSLNYLLRQKTPRRPLSRSPRRTKTEEHTMQHAPPAAPARPIMNLISTIRSRFAVSSIHRLSHRLLRESTVIAMQEAMGVVEETYRTDFPDPRSRPTFLIGMTTYRIWESSGEITSTEHKDTLEMVLSHKRLRQSPFAIRYRGGGTIKLGPIAVIPGTETHESQKRREISARYLTDKLVECTPLRAYHVDRGRSLYSRLVKAVRYSVIGPLSVLQECKKGEIFVDEKWRQIGMELIKEAWFLIRHDMNGGISLEDLTALVMREIFVAQNDMHPALLHVMEGGESDIETVSGWFVDRGKQDKPPFYCHTHQAMIDAVKAKTAKIRRELEELQKKAKEVSKEKKGGSRRKDLSIDDGADQIDKLQVKRVAKAASQRELLGKQPMPKEYVSPDISPLGNSKLRRG